ncbi:brefeldin A-inhibited guanine nucleotide-exchange protein 1-like, partial [Trifolium medium]|nr:brefeldin A-inhibited guanine nucleotide-exchange protein 1-like [Trifolium medium]
MHALLLGFDNLEHGNIWTYHAMFLAQVFTAAAADERKNIVLLAFETMEKIVREFFPYITETETTTFTDCVGCLLTFTNSRFNSDVSLNAIAFLRFCAVRLADGGLVCNKNSSADGSSVVLTNGVSDVQA